LPHKNLFPQPLKPGYGPGSNADIIPRRALHAVLRSASFKYQPFTWRQNSRWATELTLIGRSSEAKFTQFLPDSLFLDKRFVSRCRQKKKRKMATVKYTASELHRKKVLLEIESLETGQ